MSLTREDIDRLEGLVERMEKVQQEMKDEYLSFVFKFHDVSTWHRDTMPQWMQDLALKLRHG